MSFNRTWNKTNTNESQDSSQQQQQPNPFGNMRRDRDRNQNYGSAGMSYSDWKSNEKKKKEAERPLTQDDFPPLGGKVVVKTSIVTTTAHDSVSLADRLRIAIKKEEDEAYRRRIEQEEQEKKEKDAVISIALGPPRLRIKTLDAQKKQQQQEEDDNYRWQISSEIEQPEE